MVLVLRLHANEVLAVVQYGHVEGVALLLRLVGLLLLNMLHLLLEEGVLELLDLGQLLQLLELLHRLYVLRQLLLHLNVLLKLLNLLQLLHRQVLHRGNLRQVVILLV